MGFEFTPEQLAKLGMSDHVINEQVQEPDRITGKVASIKQIFGIEENRKATAPYNFVPLNSKVFNVNDGLQKDNFYKDRFTGHIELSITNLTNMYTRCSLSLEQYRINGTISSIDRPFDFFSPTGVPRISGSSIRGMVRNLYEIVSFSKFNNVEDKSLYYRSFADKSEEMNKHYKDGIVSSGAMRHNGKPLIEYDIKGGYLSYENGEYFVTEAEKVFDTTFFRIDIRELLQTKTFYRNRMGNDDFQYEIFDVVFKASRPERYMHNRGRIYIEYGRVTDIEEYHGNDPEEGWHKGSLICTGKGVRKKMQWVICTKGQRKFKINFEDYRRDVTREPAYDLEQQLKSKKYVPCFFDESAESIGHTGMLRKKYATSIWDHIPAELLSNNIYDMTENVFGSLKDKQFISRLQFGDAVLESANANFVGTKTIKTLQAPKATTFQHYLTQDTAGKVDYRDNGEIKTIRYLKSYDDKPYPVSPVRGYKQYWHRPNAECFKCQNDPELPNVDSKVNALMPGHEFKSIIRFENLTKIELGALLVVLDLPDECRHKIGMGKPIGMGSIKIVPKLFISKRNKEKIEQDTTLNQDSRYQKIENEWFADKISTTDLSEFKNTFELKIINFLKENGDESNLNSLWDIERLKQLRNLLNWTTPNGTGEQWLRQTDYLEIEPQNKYINRLVLPTAEEVLNAAR
jgi:CRISPR-associated protein (TIGR03986 family)